LAGSSFYEKSFHPSKGAKLTMADSDIPAEWRVLLAVLEERLESIDNKLTEMVSTQQKKNEDIESRLRTVERWTYTVPAALISSLVSIITMVMRG
jgi:hypothetical protein